MITKRKTIRGLGGHITEEVIEVSIIDKEQYQENVVIDTEILVSRWKGLRFRKPVTLNHTMEGILAQMSVNKRLKLFGDKVSSTNRRRVYRWFYFYTNVRK